MTWPVLGLALAATAVLELLTCYGRFRLGLRSRDHVRRYARFTFGVRIHHGYVGAAMLAAALLPELSPLAQALLGVLGGGMVFSDLVHHFVVLPLFTGRID